MHLVSLCGGLYQKLELVQGSFHGTKCSPCLLIDLFQRVYLDMKEMHGYQNEAWVAGTVLP